MSEVGKSKEAVPFLKAPAKAPRRKRDPKNISPLRLGVDADGCKVDKSFLLLFFKKEDARLLSGFTS